MKHSGFCYCALQAKRETQGVEQLGKIHLLCQTSITVVQLLELPKLKRIKFSKSVLFYKNKGVLCF